MSKETSQTADPLHRKEPSELGVFFAAGGFFVLVMAFLAILYFAYLPHQKPDPNRIVAEQRQTMRESLQADQVTTAGSFGVVDAEKKIVRIPVEEAMQLVIQEHQTAE